MVPFVGGTADEVIDGVAIETLLSVGVTIEFAVEQAVWFPVVLDESAEM